MSGIFGMIGAAAGLGPDKPKVPEYNPVDPQAAQKKALSGNIAALPEAEKLAASLNVFNADQLQAMLAKAIPNYAAIKQKTSDSILSMLKGEIPDANQIATRSAAKAVAGGFGGSEAARNLTLRDLSLSSMEYTQRGIAAADRWLSSGGGGGVPGLTNAASMFITPSQQIETEFRNTENSWNRNWLTNQIKAQPSYLEQQAMGTLDYFDSLGKTALGAYTGWLQGNAMSPPKEPPKDPYKEQYGNAGNWPVFS